MTASRLLDYLDHLHQAASDACAFIDGLTRAEFLDDRRTQKAVIMSLVIIGETATKIMDQYGAFAERHPEIPWRNMRGMRNRIAHGYFEIDLNIVWDTVRTDLRVLLDRLPTVQNDAASHDRGT